MMATSDIDRLSPREREVARAVWSEAADKEIAAGLHIAQGTLRSYMQRLMFKLGVRTRAGIAVRFERARHVGRIVNSAKADMRKKRHGRKLSP